MGKPDINVDAAVKRISLEHYAGHIKAIACVIVRDDGQLEMAIGMPHETAYGVISGLELLKHNILNDVIKNASVPPKESDV